MLRSFLIIDDFFANPHEVRRAALAMNYPAPAAGENYPGRMSAERGLWPNIDQMFSMIIGEPVRGNFKHLHGFFRLTGASDSGAADIHIDVDNVWAGVIYLNPPEQCQGGTQFFRHKKYGTDHAPVREEDFKIYGAGNRLEVLQKTIVPDGRDRDKWEMTMTLPMRWNRLVLFRSWFWHTAGPGFGASNDDMRLVQLMFFESAPPAPPRR